MVNTISGQFIPAAISDMRPYPELLSNYTQSNKSEQQKENESVTVSISQTARNLLTQLQGESLPAQAVANERQLKDYSDRKQDNSKNNQGRQNQGNYSGSDSYNRLSSSKKVESDNEAELSQDEKALVKELQKRDTEVRTHEMQHLAAAGPYAIGGANYEYETGPDGKQYAVGGSVDLNTSPVPNNPEATIQKAQVLKTAAMATGDPSSADKSVASAASQMEAEARAETQKNGGNSTDTAYTSSSSALNSYMPRLFISKGHIINIDA